MGGEWRFYGPEIIIINAQLRRNQQHFIWRCQTVIVSGVVAPPPQIDWPYGLCATRRMCDMCNLEPYLRPQRLVEQL